MKRVGIRSKIILLTLLILGGGFFVAPEILEEVAEVRYRRTLENGRANLAEALEKDYRKLNLRNTPRLGDYFVFIYHNIYYMNEDYINVSVQHIKLPILKYIHLKKYIHIIIL